MTTHPAQFSMTLGSMRLKMLRCTSTASQIIDCPIRCANLLSHVLPTCNCLPHDFAVACHEFQQHLVQIIVTQNVAASQLWQDPAAASERIDRNCVLYMLKLGWRFEVVIAAAMAS